MKKEIFKCENEYTTSKEGKTSRATGLFFLSRNPNNVIDCFTILSLMCRITELIVRSYSLNLSKIVYSIDIIFIGF